MALTVHTPADTLDLAAVMGRTSNVLWHTAREAMRAGESWAVRDGDTTVMAGGLFRLSDTVAEAWFWPGAEAGRRIHALIGHMRLTLQASPYREIITIARTPEGRVLARRLGFEPIGPTAFGEMMRCQISSEAAAMAPQKQTARPSPRNSGGRSHR